MNTSDNFRSQFPCTRQYTYLNTPAYGLLSDSLMEWRQEHDLDYLIGGSRFKDRFMSGLDSLRDTVGEFTGSGPGEVFLVPNFSFGWKALSCGLKKDIHFMLLDGDYPSLNWPVETGGFKKLTKLPVSAEMEGEILKAFESHRPDVFAFSMVQYLDGMKLDQDFLRSLKESYPDTLFVADATQYLGTERFCFRDSGIDVLGVSGYKWLLGGTGNGFFLVRSEVQDLFYRETLSWEPRKEPFLSSNSHLQNHLEPGHLDSMSMGSLQFSIEYLLKTGMEKVEEKVQSLTQYAMTALGDNGFLNEGIKARKDHGPILSLETTKAQMEALKSRDVVFAVRGGRLRVGFHFYNEQEDVDKLLKILLHSKPR